MTLRWFDGKQPQLAAGVYVDESALVMGDVVIGADSSIWPMAVVRGDVNSIRIGSRTNIQDGSILHVTHDGPYQSGGYALEIGDDVTVGHRVILHGALVGNCCLIGMGAIIMDGAVVGDYSMIGAGALISPGKLLQGGYLWLGQPARRVRELTLQERGQIEYSAAHYVLLQQRHTAAV